MDNKINKNSDWFPGLQGLVGAREPIHGGAEEVEHGQSLQTSRVLPETNGSQRRVDAFHEHRVSARCWRQGFVSSHNIHHASGYAQGQGNSTCRGWGSFYFFRILPMVQDGLVSSIRLVITNLVRIDAKWLMMTGRQVTDYKVIDRKWAITTGGRCSNGGGGSLHASADSLLQRMWNALWSPLSRDGATTNSIFIYGGGWQASEVFCHCSLTTSHPLSPIIYTAGILPYNCIRPNGPAPSFLVFDGFFALSQAPTRFYRTLSVAWSDMNFICHGILRYFTATSTAHFVLVVW